MSFKREGDDSSQLNVLKKRRVADLLANYIPEDEAMLLRDGRYACTVCFHRPVFDTLDMLTVHRSGKRHLASLQNFYGKKHSLENEVQKRRHQAYLRAEEAGAQVTPGPSPLLVQTRRIAQNALLKTTPYNSCCRRSREVENEPGPGPSRSSVGSRDPKEEVPSKPRDSLQRGEDRPVGVEVTPTACSPGSTNVTADSPKEPTRGKKHNRKRKGHPVEAPPSGPSNITPEKRQALQHYLRLKSSGWVQDGSGNWVKDENVEFDSDEEQPPALILP